MYGFYGAYNYSGLVRQVSEFSNVVSVRRVHVVLWTAGFKGGGKPCRKTRETAALRRGIQETNSNIIRQALSDGNFKIFAGK